MRWTRKPLPDSSVVAHLCDVLNVEKPVAVLLAQRGISSFAEAKKFFRPSLEDLHDPFLMKDMDVAVQRILQAVDQKERILVYGDYDVDGTTSVALVSSYLQSFYPDVATYIPDRYDEGYGISFKGIDFAADNEISLIIALDCGIKALDKIAYAREKGIEFIICDHHLPGLGIPDAVAVLDPKRRDCTYPYKELCGCGVGFKLLQALSQERKEPRHTLIPYLDLVATAIGADIVPVTGENRVLAYHGLRVINEAPREGIRAMMEQAGKRQLTLTDLVFSIAPRINAAGRMKHGQHAVDILTEPDLNQARIFAKDIEDFNQDRKDADTRTTTEALAQIASLKEETNYTTVVFQETWHKGVIGIVASRLTETYYRPTLVFTRSGEKLAASARSVKGFDVYNALESCQDYIEQFGGHKYAAGLTLLSDQYENFKKKFEQVVAQTIDRNLLTPEISIDMEMNLDEITPKFHRILKQFEPFGPGNSSPVFLSRELRAVGEVKCVGRKADHLKCTISSENHYKFPAIGFGLGSRVSTVSQGRKFDAVYTLGENHFNGKVNLQVQLKDVR